MNKTFSQLKRDLQQGTIITLINVECKNNKLHKNLNIPRKIEKKQTNAIKLEGGSWLGLGSNGETAKNFEYIDDSFTYTNGYIKLTYVISN